jgi:hypothetical protein
LGSGSDWNDVDVEKLSMLYVLIIQFAIYILCSFYLIVTKKEISQEESEKRKGVIRKKM